MATVSAWPVSAFVADCVNKSTNDFAATTQWLFNFVVTEFTPHAVNHLGWRTFLMFGIFCCANCVFAFFVIKETKRKTLEEMDVLFGAVDAQRRAEDIENAISVEKKELHMSEHVEQAVPAGELKS